MHKTHTAVFINGRFLSQAKSGTQRFAEELIKAIDIRNKELEYPLEMILLVDGNARHLPNLSTIKTHVVRGMSGHPWEQIVFYWHARKGIALSLINSGPVLHSNQVITFHDASIYDRPRLFSKSYLFFHRLLRPILARRAKRIITVSQFSARRLAENMTVSDDNIIVIPNGCDHIARIKADRRVFDAHALQPGNYILSVGNASPNKNIVAAIKAFKHANLSHLKFVIVGAADNRVFGDVTLPESDEFVRIRATDEELRALYEDATMFVFPSIYEGFGIPPLEAMLLGCPVIASGNAAIPETVGDAALIVDPENIEQFSEAIRAIYLDRTIRREYINRGYKRAELFRWNASAEACLHVLNKLI